MKKAHRSKSVVPNVSLILTALLLAGCGQESIQVYQIPKEQPPVTEHVHSSPSSQQAMPSMPAMPEVQWGFLPDAWSEKTPGPMRVASFDIANENGPAGDLSVIPLPSLAGKEVDIVNLWRQQIQLEPISNSQLDGLFDAVAIGASEGQLYDMVSETNMLDGEFRQRILVATTDQNGFSWFFKMTGPDELIAGQEDDFRDFLETVEFIAPAPSPTPVTRPSVASTTSATQGGRKLPDWKVPGTWTESPAGNMLLAQFEISRDSQNAQVTVSSFPGDVGGLLANINRWRGQIGLPPISESDLPENTSSINTSAGEATIVDFSNNETRLLAAVLPHEGSTWFFKNLGDAGLVEQERTAFMEFVKSVSF